MKPKLLVGRDLISKHNILIDVANARIMIGRLEIALREASPSNLAKSGEKEKQARLDSLRTIKQTRGVSRDPLLGPEKRIA